MRPGNRSYLEFFIPDRPDHNGKILEESSGYRYPGIWIGTGGWFIGLPHHFSLTRTVTPDGTRWLIKTETFSCSLSHRFRHSNDVVRRPGASLDGAGGLASSGCYKLFPSQMKRFHIAW